MATRTLASGARAGASRAGQDANERSHPPRLPTAAPAQRPAAAQVSPPPGPPGRQLRVGVCVSTCDGAAVWSRGGSRGHPWGSGSEGPGPKVRKKEASLFPAFQSEVQPPGFICEFGTERLTWDSSASAESGPRTFWAGRLHSGCSGQPAFPSRHVLVCSLAFLIPSHTLPVGLSPTAILSALLVALSISQP